MQPQPSVVDQWNRSARFWEKHGDTIRGMFAPVTQALVEDAAIRPGQTVLDVATGPGDPALSVAPTLGPDGKIVGIDLIPGMIAAARRAATSRGCANAEFETGSADRLPLPDSTFDAAISRFGIMFFPSPVDAVREMLRVLKPQAKLALAVWDSSQANPFFHAFGRVLERYVEVPPREPDAPDAFRFAAPGKLLQVFHDAGAAHTSERLLQFTIHAPISAEEYWTVRTEMSESFREKLAALPAAQLAELRRECL